MSRFFQIARRVQVAAEPSLVRRLSTVASKPGPWDDEAWDCTVASYAAHVQERAAASRAARAAETSAAASSPSTQADDVWDCTIASFASHIQERTAARRAARAPFGTQSQWEQPQDGWDCTVDVFRNSVHKRREETMLQRKSEVADRASPVSGKLDRLLALRVDFPDESSKEAWDCTIEAFSAHVKEQRAARAAVPSPQSQGQPLSSGGQEDVWDCTLASYAAHAQERSLELRREGLSSRYSQCQPQPEAATAPARSGGKLDRILRWHGAGTPLYPVMVHPQAARHKIFTAQETQEKTAAVSPQEQVARWQARSQSSSQSREEEEDDQDDEIDYKSASN